MRKTKGTLKLELDFYTKNISLQERENEEDELEVL